MSIKKTDAATVAKSAPIGTANPVPTTFAPLSQSIRPRLVGYTITSHAEVLERVESIGLTLAEMVTRQLAEFGPTEATDLPESFDNLAVWKDGRIEAALRIMPDRSREVTTFGTAVEVTIYPPRPLTR